MMNTGLTDEVQIRLSTRAECQALFTHIGYFRALFYNFTPQIPSFNKNLMSNTSGLTSGLAIKCSVFIQRMVGERNSTRTEYYYVKLK